LRAVEPGRYRGADVVAPQVEAAVYYVVAEALTNVTKYARATTATVTVSTDAAGAQVSVSDDGVGGADPALGSGLRGLGERVEALAGRIDVVSSPATGTRVSAWLPITAPEPGDVPAAVAGDRSGS
jgi:signal transduction histidine kinase